MIIKTFNNGWGNNYPLKQYENSLVDKMLRHIAQDASRTVVINSVWYSSEYHETVMAWLRSNKFDHIVLIAMLDAAIPYPDRYQEFACPVSAVGFYPGKFHLDFCALFLDHFIDLPTVGELLNHSEISVPYMCLNRKPHWHRQRFYIRLESMGIVDKGFVSMGSDTGTPVRSLLLDREHDDLAPNATRDHYGIPNDIVSLGHMANWKKSFLNVVTETFYDINKMGFVSEKIYKPIVGCRPFLVYDPDGGTKWLIDRGFQPYVRDFQDITDLDLSLPENLAPFLKVLCDQPASYYPKKFIDLREKILYNKEQFSLHVAKQHQTIEKGIPCLT